MSKKSILFICLGNICRSPIAEALFLHKISERGLTDKFIVESAATGDWHIGLGPDKRTMKCLKSHGVDYRHVVRRITKEDFTKFDIIFGMDNSNMEDLNDLKPANSTAELKMLGEYDPQKQLVIQDPYYGEYKDFEQVYIQCERCVDNFLDEIAKQIGFL